MESEGKLEPQLADQIREQARAGADPELPAAARDNRLDQLLARLAETVGYDGNEIEGTLDAVVVVRTLPRTTVARLLPRGLQLAPHPVAHHSLHPVVVLVAQEHLHAWFGPEDFHSFTVAIPFVERTDRHIPHRGPFLYVPRAHVDDPEIQKIGNLVYAQEQRPGRFDDGDEDLVVEDEDGRRVATLRAEGDGSWCVPRSLPGFDTLRTLLDMPTVGQGARIYDRDAFERKTEGFFVCFNRTLCFGDPEARVQPMKATLQLHDALTPPGLPTEPFTPPPPGGIEVAFRLQVPQRLSAPGSCATTHFAPATPQRPQRVVVLGGGPAACAAAFYLAQQPERYSVKLYTRGFRLGGKCAAGRNEGEFSERIEEHGLHAFLGFYENVFRTLREIYRTADLPISVGQDPYDHDAGEGPLARALLGRLDVGLVDRHGGGWHYFETGQRFAGGVPGVIPNSESDEIPGIGQLLLAIMERIRVEIDKLLGRKRSTQALVSTRRSRENTLWQRLVAWLRRLLGLKEKPGLGTLLDQLTDYHQELLVERIGTMLVERSVVMRALGLCFKGIRALLKSVFADDIEEDRQAWFTWSNLDLVLTVAVGIIESATVDASDLDDQDFQQWLLDHGLDPRNRDIAAVTMVYNTLYANQPGENGEVQPGNLACGVALRWFLLVGFGYKGYPVYDFHGSCPQTVFTPYYLALQKLGVEIHFFHEVTDLQVEGTTAESRQLTGICMRRQARVEAGSAHYQPFLPPGRRNDPEGIPAWPRAPQWDQLHPDDARALQDRGIDLEDSWSDWEGVGEVTLRQGEDFDLCVLGIPLGALREPARALYDASCETADPGWTAMMRTSSVTPTASFQLWFDRPWERLYSGEHRDLLTGYLHPWPSLGELSHIIEWEGWPEEHTPLLVAYHTGAGLPGHPFDQHPPDEHDFTAREQSRQQAEMKAWLQENYRGLYDQVQSWNELLGALTAPPGTEGQARLDAQYFHAAFQPSDLYVLSPVGSVKHRLGQGESGYRHLFLCGDWTHTSLDCGCVEAATQSGMLAARVISNRPSFVWSPGF